MNILFYTFKSSLTGAVGGAESSIQLIAQKLKEKGHSVIWLTNSAKETSFICPLVEKSRIESIDIRIYKPSEWASRFNFVKKWNKRFYKKNIAKLVYQYNIDIIYCFYDLKFLNTLFELKKTGLNIPVVMRMAGLYWYEQCLKAPHLVHGYENIFNSIDSVNFIHSGLERMVVEKFKELGMNVVFKKSFVGDIGSSAKIGRKQSYPALSDQSFKLIMATRFSNYQKRQDILVKAVSLIDQGIPIRVTLIGDGSERSRIRQMVKNLDLEDRIEIEPFTAQAVLWDKLETADMLCHACDHEGLSKIIIESMALGLPVLASNVPPLNEYIKEGENGFLVDNTEQAWAEKIATLYYNKEARIRVSENEIEFVKEHYDPEKNIKIYEEHFLNVISSN